MGHLVNFSSSTFLVLGLLLSGVSSSFIINQNHDKVTIRNGEEAELLCTAQYPVKRCSFRSPKSESFQMFPGARFEGGRIVSFENNEFDCGIKINSVKEEDNGEWECSIVALSPEDTEVKTGKGFVNLTVAVAPLDIKVYVNEEPAINNRLEIRLEEEEASAKDIKCEAVGARPAPTFVWKIGETVIKGETEDSQMPNGGDKVNYAQTLRYYPTIKHNGQQLTCSLDHLGYSVAQIQARENEKTLEIELLFKPKEKAKEDIFYVSQEGIDKTIHIKFEAYPEPTEVSWHMAGVENPLASGATSLDDKYHSADLEQGDIPGEYTAALTIKKVSKDQDTDKEHYLSVTNEEGQTQYKFKLMLGAQRQADGVPVVVAHEASEGGGEPLSSGPVVGVIIVVVVILILIVFALVARSKGILCFADQKKSSSEDKEQTVEKEGSDTESAEDHPDGKKSTTSTASTNSNGKTVTVKVSNIFAAVKKSVSVKDKKMEAELKGGDEKKDVEKGGEVTYADLDKSALNQGKKRSNLTTETETSEYAEIQKPSKDDI